MTPEYEAEPTQAALVFGDQLAVARQFTANLAQYGEEQLISRSQAKRLIARFDKFKKVVLDFQGVREIGQAFSDELFRVYGKNNPQIELIPMNMEKGVEQMWLRAITPSL